VPDIVVGDVSRLRQVLVNLLGNAIKFTEAGEVLLEMAYSLRVVRRRLGRRTTRRASLLHSRHWHRHPAAQQRSIFQAFEQEDMSTTRKYGGTGLGLTIATRLIALMGGDLSVHSEVGRGSTFAFTHALAAQRDPRAWKSFRSCSRLRTCGCRRQRHEPKVARGLAARLAARPASLGDSSTVLETLHRGLQAGESYALLLLDANMPGEGGWRWLPRSARATRSVERHSALTGSERPADIDRYRELKINAQLLKPVLRNELLETLHTLTLPRASWQRTPHRSSSSRVKRPQCQCMRCACWSPKTTNELRASVAVTCPPRAPSSIGAHGREALRLVEADDYDLLLLDVHMPEWTASR